MDTMIEQLEVAKEIYPYDAIASNPPNYPSQEYFGIVNFTQEFAKLKTTLKNSGGVTSVVYRAVMQFIAKFHDGHFSLSSAYTTSSKNLFTYISGVFPFTWTPLGQFNGKIRVQLNPTSVTKAVAPNLETVLKAKIDSGVYAKTIDGKDAFEFFRDFFASTNDMKSTQGKLYISRLFTGTSFFRLTYYPLNDNDFNEHTVVFSDDSTMKFNIAFRNSKNAPTTRDLEILPTYDVTPKGRPDYEVIDAIKNFKPIPKSKRLRANKYVQCTTTDTMNGIVFSTFSTETPEDIDVFLTEASDCIKEFDNNKNPIFILLLQNGGGYDVISTVVRSWLLPTSDSRYIKAVKKTDTNKELARTYYGRGISDIETCNLLESSQFDEFWSKTEVDDFGKGALHVRTQKFIDDYYGTMKELKEYGLVKNPRKPTDVIVVTDGYCFSACSYFANSVAEVGSAIVAGIGATNIGDEKFVSSQCPSNVASPLHGFFPKLATNAQKYGIQVGVTLGETFHPQRDLNVTQIPRDYTISRIDANLGDFFVSFDVQELVQKGLELHQSYQEKCNPDNQRLFMYTGECNSGDENAKQMGYACGTDGKWNTSDCRVAICKPGYIVDFEGNSCMRNYCEEVSNSASIAHFGVALLLVFALFLLL